ncbi:MAG: coproporphyrinogen-III oxidase family protein [Chitinophagales bacterium]
MSGIYIHIPFCKQSCHYCNFHFSTSLVHKNELLSALLKEMEINAGLSSARKEVIETVYLGGGTPSLFSANECAALIEKARNIFEIDPLAEITLEANPDDITKEKLKGWKDAGINRLSMGIQSFFDEDLVWMNRAHDAKQAINCMDMAKAEFENISVDLIYGVPGLTGKKWEQNGHKPIPSLYAYYS